jgi:hypothetical protein
VTLAGALVVGYLLALTSTPGAHDGSSPGEPLAISVIVPADANASMRDALIRLRGEADSVGFAVRLLGAPAGMDPQSEIDRVARADAPTAVVALQPSQQGGAPGPVDVWFFDRSTGKTSTGHLSVEPGAGDRSELVLAVRVVDFIRARMFDALVRSQALAQPTPTPPPPPALAGRRSVGLGLAAIGSFHGLGTARMPWLDLGYRARPWLELTFGLGGLGSRPRVDATQGSATVVETLLLLGASVRRRLLWRIFPMAQVGASMLLVSVHGEGKPGYLGHDQSGWSPGLFATAGMEVVLASHVYLRLLAGGSSLMREPKVVINDVEVARTGRPAWLAQASLGVGF